MRLELLQLNKDFIKSAYVGKIKFSYLNKIAVITSRKVAIDGNSNNLFQRPSDSLKISKLSKFLSDKFLDNKGKLRKKTESNVVFPTAIIISLNQNDIDNEARVIWKDNILEFDESIFSAFIVDGQHRFLGIKKFYEDNKISENDIDIELPVTLLIGYDLWEQSRIFAEVNFNQKPVNKSLYYDLFGSMPGDPNEEKLAHLLVKYLNNEQGGPFEGLVKMLGIGNGVISQAFLVEKVMKLFSPNKAFSGFFEEYKNGKTDQRMLAKTISLYFNVIRNRFSKYYPKKNDNGEYSSSNQDILFKTTGIGAFCRLFDDFQQEIKIHKGDIDYLNNYFNKTLSLISNEKAEELFSKNGQFAGGSSEGTQVRLYKELIGAINYRKDVVGKTYQNAKILEIKSKDVHSRNMHEVTMDNGTTNIIGDEDLLNIKNS